MWLIEVLFVMPLNRILLVNWQSLDVSFYMVGFCTMMVLRPQLTFVLGLAGVTDLLRA